MTPSRHPDSSREGLLEEVLRQYMQCLDRGEVVDREQFLARHPELAEELRSYFAGCDEVERLGRQAREGTTELLSRGRARADPLRPAVRRGGPAGRWRATQQP